MKTSILRFDSIKLSLAELLIGTHSVTMVLMKVRFIASIFAVFALATTRFRTPLQSPPIPPTVLFRATSPLNFSCPFSPEGMNPAPDLFVEIAAQSHVLYDDGFAKGLSNLLVLPNRTLLDLHAGLGQLYTALERNCVNVNYLGLEPARNVMDISGHHLSLGGGTEMVVPQLCWADMRLPISLGRKFDVVVAIIADSIGDREAILSKADNYIRAGGMDAKGIFLDNVVRLAKETIVLGWHTNNLLKEMKARGAMYDSYASKRMKESSDMEWIKSRVAVFRVHQNKSAVTIP